MITGLKLDFHDINVSANETPMLKNLFSDAISVDTLNKIFGRECDESNIESYKLEFKTLAFIECYK